MAPYSKSFFSIVSALTEDKKIVASTFQCNFGVGSMNVVRFRQKTALYEKTQLSHSVGCNSYIWEQKNKAEKPLKNV